MYTVYILKDVHGKIYKGMTNNIKRRLEEHRAGKTKTTRYMKEIKIVYSEDFNDFVSARKRELYFKSAAGRKYLKKIERTISSVG